MEDVAASGADRLAFSGSIDVVASGATYEVFSGVASETDAGTPSGFVGVTTLGTVPGTVSVLVDGFASGADRGAPAADPDAIPGAIHEPFSSDSGVKAFSKSLDCAPAGAAGIIPPVVV